MAPRPPEDVNGPTTCCACNTLLTQEGLRFPKNPELRNKWVDIIISNTPDYPGKRAALDKLGVQLCPKHFEENMLIRKNDGGNITYALRKGGFPTLFDVSQMQNGHHPLIPNSNLVDSTTQSDDEDIEICYEMIPTTSEVKTQLSDTNPSPEVMDVEDTSNIAPELEAVPVDNILTNHESVSNAVTGELSNNLPPKSDVIPSLQEFIAVLKQKNDQFYDPWKILYQESSVLFTMFDADCKYLIQSFTVDENLKVCVFYHGQLFSDDGLKDVLGVDSLLNSWTKFKKLILFLHTITKDKQHHTLKLKHACKLIQECIDSGTEVGFTEKQIKKLKFSLNQVQISDGKDITYTAENLQWAMNTYIVNRLGYAKIYESDFLSLPHPASLEIYKRQMTQAEQARKQQQFIRSKFVAKKPYIPSTQNGGSSPNAHISDISVLKNKDNLQQSSLNNTSANHNSTVVSMVQNELSGNNNVAVDDDDDCEIQLLQD